MNNYLMPKENGGGNKVKVDKKRLIVLVFLGVLFLGALFLFYFIDLIRQKPNYLYRDFKWSEESSYIAYLRIALRNNATQNPSETCDHEVWIDDLKSSKRSYVATIKGGLDSVKILGWDSDRIVIEQSDGLQISLYYIYPGGKLRRYNLAMPGLRKILFDRGILFTLQDDAMGQNKKIGYFRGEDFAFTQLLNFDLREGESLEFLSARVSPEKDMIALGIYFSTSRDEAGSSHVWICDLKKRKLSKLETQSYGKYISFAWSPFVRKIAASVAEQGENGQVHYAINFHGLYEEASFERLTTASLKEPLSLCWNDDKLFLILKDTIYLMRLDPEPIAKPLLSWDSVGYVPADFDISPDGSKIVFHSVSDGTSPRDDAYLMDVDGTDVKRLIQPEGRRFFERIVPTGFFMFLHQFLRSAIRMPGK